MKKTIITTLILSTIVIANCKTINQGKKNSDKKAKTGNKTVQVPPKEINYILPDDSLSMSDSAKKEFVMNFDKGQIIYNIVCAKCHNKLVDGVEVVPDFSLPQLMDYEMRIEYPAHQERLTEANLSALELDHVVDYLRYKKKSGVHF